MTISQALQIAVQHHRAGRLAEAEGHYRRILAAQPDHADALHLLGVVAHQTGRHELAAEWIRQSIFLNPKNHAAHCNLGEACRAMGRFDEAMDAYRQAIQVKPDFPDAHYNLGNALRDRGELDEAIAAYRHALQVKPDYLEAHNNLGNALREGGQLDKAVAAYRRALEFKPDSAEARSNLGIALHGLGRFNEAIALYRGALEVRPGLLEAHNNLGAALKELGQLDEAVAEYRRALELEPGYPEAHNGLGSALKDLGRLDEAIAAFRRALQLKPEDASAHSNLIYALHFHRGCDGKTISEEHQRWNRQFSKPMEQCVHPRANDRSLRGRLRIGYVSPDFRDHPVGRHVLPLFERHDRERFEILCYSGVTRPDAMTERLRALAGPARNASPPASLREALRAGRSDAGGGWRSTVGVPDARLAEMIREDGVDILVDLAMHTAGNRLPMFARQSAPVQVAWLAYPGSTGLDSIGYRLTDAHMDPPGEERAWSSEEPVRLPDCWCCYQPVGESPEINALPAWSAEGVTFGSLNNFAKVNESVLALWARVLDAVKGCKLLMLCPIGQARKRVLEFFRARGVAAERLELASPLPRWEYLSLYQRIDLALDPFPCSGMTTTCDALWMGAPVLTLPGTMPVSRASLSLLSSVGLMELAAYSEEDYVRMALELAGDLPRLADLRATLRARMLASPLMDAPRFARNVEAAYLFMWQRWRAARQ